MADAAENEAVLLERWLKGDAQALTSLIESTQQKIFALALYLIGGDRDKAYEMAASSIVDALRQTPSIEKKGDFLVQVARALLEKSKQIQAKPVTGPNDFLDFPPDKRRMLQIARDALQALPFETKILLLLRDQSGFSFQMISDLLQVPPDKVRMDTLHARSQLRIKIQEVLSHGRTARA